MNFDLPLGDYAQLCLYHTLPILALAAAAVFVHARFGETGTRSSVRMLIGTAALLGSTLLFNGVVAGLLITLSAAETDNLPVSSPIVPRWLVVCSHALTLTGIILLAGPLYDDLHREFRKRRRTRRSQAVQTTRKE